MTEYKTSTLPRLFRVAAGHEGAGRNVVAQQLFDTATDFYERKDIAAFYGARMAAWRALLNDKDNRDFRPQIFS